MPRIHWKPSREIACAFGLVLSTGFFVQADDDQKADADKKPTITVTVEASASDEDPAKKDAEAASKKVTETKNVPAKTQKTISTTVTESVTEKVVDGVPQKVQVRIQKSTDGDGTGKPKVVVQKQGKIVVVGPDGKTHAFEFEGDTIPDLNELLDKEQLSDEVRVRIGQALKTVDGALANPAATTLEAQVIRIHQDGDGADGSKGKDGKKLEWREAQVIAVDEDGQSIRIIRQPGSRLIRVEPTVIGVPWKADSKAVTKQSEGIYRIELHGDVKLHGDIKADHRGYVIGIQCDAEIPPSLNAQLNLGGTGVLVNSVVEDSPAAEAGIQSFDVVVAINDKVVDSVESLQKLIGEAGKNGKAVELIVLRKGKKQTISVKPKQVEQAVNSFVVESAEGALAEGLSESVLKKLKENGEFQLHIAQPGFVFKSEGMSEEQLQKLKKHMAVLKSAEADSVKQFKSMQPMIMAIPGAAAQSGHSAEMAKELQTLKKQVAELQQMIKKMQSQSSDREASDKKPARDKKADRDKSESVK